MLLILGGCGYSFSVQAKVADFGLLKSVPSGEELADQGKGVAGTPGYIVNSLGLHGVNVVFRVRGSGCTGFGLRL